MAYKNKEKQAARHKAYYEANKEKRAACAKAWYAANKDKKAAYNRKHATGWTQEQYDEKLAEQGGRCGICGVDTCSSGRALNADHCHTTGKPRGILCAKCNKAIGALGDNVDGLRRALEYLQKYELKDIKPSQSAHCAHI